MLERVDPELRKALEVALKEFDQPLNADTVAPRRASMKEMTNLLKANYTPPEGIELEVISIPARNAPDIELRIARPQNASGPLPAILWMHGGGYVMGDAEIDDPTIMRFAKNANCIAVSVQYRLAPEHPYPAPLDDCYTALKWMADQAVEQGIDKNRIAIGGSSAGGGLAAGLALLARDRAEVALCGQVLIYPMIDDRNTAPANPDNTDTLVWNRASNIYGWGAYLGKTPASADVDVYAAPSRAEDLSGLPPACIPTGALDLFVHENIAYAQNLIKAGVATDFHVFAGAPHGFNTLAPNATVSRACNQVVQDFVKQVLNP